MKIWQPESQASLTAQAHWTFGTISIISVIIFWKTVAQLIFYSLHNDAGSHIVLIPVVSAYFLLAERKRVFAVVKPSLTIGAVMAFTGIALYGATYAGILQRQGDESLSVRAIALIFVWVGGFLCSYGVGAARRAMFALSVLVLMVPLPDQLVDKVVFMLQSGSTDLSYSFFRVLGVPTLRQGFFLTVPGVTIEVARECSGIHSSIALFITTLLAAQLFLHSSWRKAVFVIVALPLAIIKNAIRIVSLTLLSIHVDPSFLTGKLHHQGGIVFFLLALALLAPVLKGLRTAETAPRQVSILERDVKLSKSNASSAY
jgi:exosortase